MRMLVRVLAARRLRTALAVDPAGVAVAVVLLLPDRHPVLDLVDDEAAGGEGLATVRAADADPHRELAEAERTDAVHAARAAHAEAAHGLGDDPFAFLDRELGVGLVLEALDREALVVVADPALEGREAAAGRILERAPQRGGLERAVAELEARHVSRPRPAG